MSESRTTVNISRDQVAEMIYESAMFKLWKWTLRTSRELAVLNEECGRDEFRRKCESLLLNQGGKNEHRKP